MPRCYQDRALSTMASVMFASEDGFCDSGGDGSEGGSGDEGSGDEGSDDEDGRGRGRGSVRADRDDDDEVSTYRPFAGGAVRKRPAERGGAEAVSPQRRGPTPCGSRCPAAKALRSLRFPVHEAARG